MTKKTTLTQASQLIRSARQPLIICHIAPDGDAIGSLVGLGRALSQAGWAPVMACHDPIPSEFDYVPGIDDVVQDTDAPYDLVITLDCGDEKRLGHWAQKPGFWDCPLINIDHHVTNEQFGQVNLVDPQAASTAEIVLHLLNHMDIPLDAEIATSLLVGVITDTRGLRTNNVTDRVLEGVLQLTRAGASLPYVAYHGLDRRPTSVIRLWGAGLAQMQIEDRVIWTRISQEARRAAGFDGTGSASLVSFLVSSKDADASAVFSEREDGRVEVGFRAVEGFDVAGVALQFGGGGHALAAGCDVPGPLSEAEAQILPVLRAEIARQRSEQT